MKIGLIGYGTIGQTLARAIWDELSDQVSLVAVKGRSEQPPFAEMPGKTIYTTNLEAFLATGPEVVIEAASQAVLKQYAPLVVKSSKYLIAMSIGGFTDPDFLAEVSSLAKEYHCRIFLPAGAIGGLDAVSAAALDEIYEVSLTTTKPVRALQGNSPAINSGLDLNTITAPTCLYEGPAEDAVRRFPQNINVAAALSLAGIGFKRTVVRIVADPYARQNTHQIEVRGKFGELRLELKLLPSPTNPKTSYLAALSAIRTIRNLVDTVKVGT